jgi:hypothetical protein
MTRSTLAVAADYADAMLIARFWKNLLFLILFLILLVQIGVFLGVRFYTAKTEGGITVNTGAATQPAVLAGQDLSSGLFYLVNVTVFLAMITVVVLAVVLLLIVGIMLVGRLIGVTHVTRAFILTVVVGTLLFPWQALWNYPIAGTTQPEPDPKAQLQVGPGAVIPGVLYTFPELQHRAHADMDKASSAGKFLFWARFVGIPLFTLILLLKVQTNSSRGLKFALGEAEVQLVDTPTNVQQTGA